MIVGIAMMTNAAAVTRRHETLWWSVALPAKTAFLLECWDVRMLECWFEGRCMLCAATMPTLPSGI